MAHPHPTSLPTASDAPLISVIIPSHNKARFIADTVASVRAQTNDRWELLVIDDASTDESPTLLQRLAEEDPRIRVALLPVNRGANHCRNRGIAEARGTWIVFLDADDLLAPHCLEERAARMATGAFDLAVFTMEVFRERVGDHGQRWVPDTTDALRDFLRHTLPWQTMQPIWDRVFLERLGGFDPSFTRHQDVELHTRALFVPGVRVGLFPGPPDCFYRIAEERKVMAALPLLQRFSEAAVAYHRKFLAQARAIGSERLLLGIIFRTYLQVLGSAKAKTIDRAALDELEGRLMSSVTGRGQRLWFRWLRAYNLLPMRVPGVNFLLFRVITGTFP